MPKPAPAIKKFPYILVDEDGQMYGISSEAQASLYSTKASGCSIYDVEAGTEFGSTWALSEASEISDDEEDEEDDDQAADEAEADSED